MKCISHEPALDSSSVHPAYTDPAHCTSETPSQTQQPPALNPGFHTVAQAMRRLQQQYLDEGDPMGGTYLLTKALSST